MDTLVEIKQAIPNAEVKSAAEPEEKRGKCPVILTQGKNEGKLCDRPLKHDSDFCSAHHFSANREGSKLREKLVLSETKSEDDYEEYDDFSPVHDVRVPSTSIPNKDLRELIDQSTKNVDLALQNNTEHLKQVEKVLKLKILESLIDLAKLIL